MLIETHRRLVLGVNHQRENSRFRPHRTRDRVDDQPAAEPLPAKSPIDGKPAGILAVADPVKPGAREALAALRALRTKGGS